LRSPSVTRKRLPAGALLFLLALVATGCAEKAPQDILEPLGEVSRKADSLWDVTFLIAAVVFFLVEGALVFALIKFRHKPGRRAEQFHGNTKLEVILTVVPSLILAGLAIPTVKTIFDLAEQPPNDAIHVTVTGRQFWWKYEYHDFGFVTANELHIPVNKAVEVTVTADDVIHSWWVPRLSGKLDAIPGRTNSITIKADRPGRYMGQCTEFCGLSHANMRLIVYAHPQDEFGQWVRDQQQEAADTPPETFTQICSACHAVAGTDAQADIGPDLTHFGSRGTFAGAIFENNEENLALWLRDPPAMKPGSKMPNYNLSEEQIQELVDYLLSLD
jgi:cytochrome c oxidase subunit II